MDYYDLFSFSAKKALYRANEICIQFSNEHVEPEHIFYSILNLRSCSAVQVLHQLEVNLPKLTYSLEAYLYEHAGGYKGQPSFSARTLALLDTAFREVKRLRHREIGTMHLLFALAQDRNKFIHGVFADHGADDKQIRDALSGQQPSLSPGAGRQGEQVQSRFSGQQQTEPGEPALPPVPETVIQAVLAEAEHQSHNWGHELVQPLHLLAAVVHLYPECDLVQGLLGIHKPAKLIYMLLNSVECEVVPPAWHVALSEASIAVLTGALGRALRDGHTKINWQNFTQELMASFSEAQRKLIDSIREQAPAEDDMTVRSPFPNGQSPPNGGHTATASGASEPATATGPDAVPPAAPAPPEAEFESGAEE